ncbi:MAG: hypothetical protein ACUVTX_10750, partial [Bacteroidales bacterium]
MKMKIFSFVLVVCVNLLASGQKIPLTHDVYDGWKSLSSSAVSDDGKWITYEINPQQGDGWLYIFNTATKQSDSVFCGFRASFSPESRYIVCMIKPKYAETRKAKVKKLKEDQMPKNNLFIKIPENGKIINVENVKSYSLPESGSQWMAYLLEKKPEDKLKERDDTLKTEKAEKSTAANTKKQPEPKGTEFVLFNPLTGKEFRYNDITEYVAARNGTTISFLQKIPDTTKIDNYKVFQFNTQKETSSIIFEGKGTLQKLACDKSGELLSFMYTSDTSKLKVFDLYLSESGNPAVKVVVSENNPDMPEGWSVSENKDITFSDDRTRLFFGTAPKPEKEPDDTLLAEEKYKVDIWSWNDDLLQPMQKKQLDQEKKRAWLAVYHIERKKMIQLATREVPEISILLKGNCDYALGTSNLKYRKFISWDANNYADYYLVNVETGTRTLILEKAPSRVIISPSGKYIIYWDIAENQWISYSVLSKTRNYLTKGIPYPLYNELSDTPSEPYPYGIAGWIDDEKHVLIYDRYDIWTADLSGAEKPYCLTNGYGRSGSLTLRYERLDRDADFIGRKEVLYLSAFNNLTKEAGFFTIKYAGPENPDR